VKQLPVSQEFPAVKAVLNIPTSACHVGHQMCVLVSLL